MTKFSYLRRHGLIDHHFAITDFCIAHHHRLPRNDLPHLRLLRRFLYVDDIRLDNARLAIILCGLVVSYGLASWSLLLLYHPMYTLLYGCVH